MNIRGLRIMASFLPVILGGFIYIIFRTERLIMFRWFRYINLSDTVDSLQKISTLYTFPNWFKYSLPDGLWIYSYTAISTEIWGHYITKQNVFWILSVPAVAILSEVFQLLKVVPGTFDCTDLAFYLMGLVIPFLTSKKQFFNTNTYEKH